MEIEDILKYMLTFFQDIDKRLSELSSKQSEWDIKQDELLHYIENHNLDAVKSCKIIKQLKYVRAERRQVKNEIDVIRSLKDTFVDAFTEFIAELDDVDLSDKTKQHLYDIFVKDMNIYFENKKYEGDNYEC